MIDSKKPLKAGRFVLEEVDKQTGADVLILMEITQALCRSSASNGQTRYQLADMHICVPELLCIDNHQSAVLKGFDWWPCQNLRAFLVRCYGAHSANITLSASPAEGSSQPHI